MYEKRYFFYSLLNLFVPLLLILGPVNILINYIFLIPVYKENSVAFTYIIETAIVLGSFPGLLWIMIAFDGVPAFLGLPKYPIISFNGKSYRVIRTEAGVVIEEATGASGAFLLMLAIRIFGNMFIIIFTFVRNFFVFIVSLFSKKGREKIIDSGIYFKEAMNKHPHMTRFAAIGCVLDIVALVLIIVAFAIST